MKHDHNIQVYLFLSFRLDLKLRPRWKYQKMGHSESFFSLFSFFLNERIVNIGPWWWLSGQHARLILRRSELEFRWSVQFFCKICIWKERKYTKRGRVSPFKKQLVKKILFKMSTTGLEPVPPELTVPQLCHNCATTVPLILVLTIGNVSHLGLFNFYSSIY